MLCEHCKKRSFKCIAVEGSKRCSRCIHAGLVCSLMGVKYLQWAVLRAEEEQLRISYDKALNDARECLAQCGHLEKQRLHLQTRGEEMLRQGLKTMDELEAAEEKEKQDQEEKEKEEGVALGSLLASTDVPIDFGLGSLAN